jgi:Putative metal-binding motif/RTX calcium-binding nonapeptide repeat (4 copies)
MGTTTPACSRVLCRCRWWSAPAPATILLTGGLEADTFSGGSGRDLLSTGDGDDVLDGGAGPDDLRAGEGRDTVAATDGAVDRVDCGAGVDGPADVDTIDVVAGCEAPRPTNALESDRDHDGFSRQLDCNDDTAAVNPGAADLPDDGVDQNCDGRDAHVSDRDGDGVPEPFDCDDRKPAIHPGAVEVPGNDVDENCNGRADPWQTPLVTPVALFQSVGSKGRMLRVRRLTLTGVPARARVRVSCKGRGCPLRTVSLRAPGSRLALAARLRRARLRKGARLTITVSSPGNLDAVIVFLARPPAIPAPTIRCRAPGSKRSRPCVAVA